MVGTDWVRWHDDYRDPLSPLSQRLRVVQRFIRETLDERGETELRAVSLCAGNGTDFLDVLADHPARERVSARLIELDLDLAAAARARITAAHLDRVEVVVGDAGATDAYGGAVPADLVLACGVFGNVSDADVERTVRALPQLCSAKAVVIWTRHRRRTDLTTRIRRWFTEAGFVERAFVSPGADSFAVHELHGRPLPLRHRQRLFTFER